MPPTDPKNRLNDLDSRSWLQFQKSWFLLEDDAFPAFCRYFSKAVYGDRRTGLIYYEGAHRDFASLQPREIETPATAADNAELDYIFLDWRDARNLTAISRKLNTARQLAARLRDRQYLTIAVQNPRLQSGTLPLAWHVAARMSEVLHLKDEKIGCLPAHSQQQNGSWAPDESSVYYLNFRRDTRQSLRPSKAFQDLKDLPPRKTSAETHTPASGFNESWFIHRPPRRAPGLVLHPAKFPEDLVARYINTFSQPGALVLDPMAGTGSSLVAAQQCGRRACGIELNPDFAKIAKSRLSADSAGQLVLGDARDPVAYQALPAQVDYCITSPPYWDMLRMRGAETQAKRQAAGLQRWYSDDERDLGNETDYQVFLNLLGEVYTHVVRQLRPGAYLTIIVKNVKKKGVIYPLAWDIADLLQGQADFMGEQFWCQDDQRLAPYGYRFAWVSNTFHHYCLTFRKP